jgi:glycosyltransferase involved in cell wall biosynthesis
LKKNQSHLNKSNLNVLFLPKWYPSKFDEFDGNFIENHAISLSKVCNIGVIFVHSDEQVDGGFTVEMSEKHGFHEYRIFYQRPKFSFRLLNQAIGFLRYRKAQLIGYKKYLQDVGRPNICHVHVNGRSALLANFLNATEKIPFLITEHWSGYTKESGVFRGFFRKKFYQFTATKSSGITCVSNYLKEAVQSHGIESSFSIVPNVVNTELFQPVAERKEGKIRIAHISNLSKTPKNIHLIVEALHQVGLQRTDFEVDFIGTGTDEEYLLSQLDKSSLAERYTFHGEVELPQVASILAKADFMLLYSQFETQSVVMLESFACGVPVLMPNVGGIPEHVNKERGILLPPNSAKELEKGILEMLHCYQDFDKSKLRNYAVEHFSEGRIRQQFITLYNQILQK